MKKGRKCGMGHNAESNAPQKTWDADAMKSTSFANLGKYRKKVSGGAATAEKQRKKENGQTQHE